MMNIHGTMNTLAGPKELVLLDLDGTLCDSAHRVHLAQNKDWDGFHSLLVEDQPNYDIVWFLANLPPFAEVVVVTGRPEKWRKATEEWLAKHGLSAYVDEMLMRPDHDYRQDHELKVAMLDETFGSREEWTRRTMFALDDRDKVVEAYRNAGVVCWQVRQGTY
jgi:phosphoglycolate phosphatase-like HAD superfamily hydrolase